VGKHGATMSKTTDAKALNQKIRDILEYGYFTRCKHFQERSELRDISDFLAIEVLSAGKIVGDPEWSDEFENWKATVEGETLDGERIRIGVAVDLVDEKIYMLTAFAK